MTNETTNVQSGYFTQERIQGDLDYKMAQQMAKTMLDSGLISVDEFDKLSEHQPQNILCPCSRKYIRIMLDK